ncbi:MAG: LON peptidase substrate-binding domain-containing protein [Hyphomicrobiales bacterium]
MKFLEKYTTPGDLPKKLPVFPLTGALLLPRAQLPLNIFEPRYLQMVNDAMSGERLIGMVQPAGAEAEYAEGNPEERPPVYPIGCAGRIISYAETPDGRILITLAGVSRFRIKDELSQGEPYRVCDVDFLEFESDLEIGMGENAVDRDALMSAFRKYLDANRMDANWKEVESATTEALVNTLCVISPYAASEKQAMLEANTLSERAKILIALTEMALASGDLSKGGPAGVQ